MLQPTAIQLGVVTQRPRALAAEFGPPVLYTAALLLTWLLLAGPVLPGLSQALLEAEAQPQLFLGAALLAAAGLARFRRKRRAGEDGQPLLVQLSAGPWLHWGPLLLLGLSALSLSLGRYALWPPALLALPLCTGSYALLALYRPPALFRRGLPLLLVVLLLVPFQFHLDAMLGFQARRLVARLVQLQLGWLAIPATAVQSVLLFDGGAAHVDLPCSGLRSLWSGALFYVGLSGLRRVRLGLRWVLGLGLLFVSIVYLNQARVLILVLLANVWHRSELADLAHVPLGLLFFLLACACASLLLPKGPAEGGGDAPYPASTRLPGWAQLGLCVLLLGLARFAASPPPPQPLRVPVVELPPDFRVQPLTPRSAEVDLLARHGGVLHKWRFVTGPAAHRPLVSGTLLLSISRSFQAQHSPHVCLATAGLQVTGMQRIWLRSDLPLAQLSLAGYRGSAVYWFQSATETTDDVLRRSLPRLLLRQRGTDAAREPPPWALVSILFDGPIEPKSPEVRELLLQLHSAVAATLRGIP